jgi:hypothetical protein
VTRSDGFVVDPAALSEAHAGIGRLLRDMNELARPQPGCPPSVFGHAELAASAEEFHERWQGGVDGLVNDTESIRSRLGETVTEYRRVEESIVAVFDRLGGDDAR